VQYDGLRKQTFKDTWKSLFDDSPTLHPCGHWHLGFELCEEFEGGGENRKGQGGGMQRIKEVVPFVRRWACSLCTKRRDVIAYLINLGSSIFVPEILKVPTAPATNWAERPNQPNQLQRVPGGRWSAFVSGG